MSETKHTPDKALVDIPSDQTMRLIKAAPDTMLLLSAICLGVARWEFLTGSRTQGEVCCLGLRYSTRLNEFSVPIVDASIRWALTEAIKKAGR